MIEVKGGLGPKVDLGVDEVDSPIEEGFREESLIKAPLPKDLKCLARPKIRTKIDVIIAISEDILQWNVHRKLRAKIQNHLRERNLKIIHMLIVVQKSPNWQQPQQYPKLMRML